jgi:hypothetical protein
MRVINSVAVSYGEEDKFDLPYKPDLLTLRHFDGDEVAAEFFLYDRPSCGQPETYVRGYDTTKDRVAHYYFQLTDTDGKRVRGTSLQGFHLQKPTLLRHWNFKFVNASADEATYDIRFVPEPDRFEGSMDSKCSANLRK